MKAGEIMKRARRTATSARLLLDSGDTNGACNRAYYAIFDAARAALMSTSGASEPEIIKTHSGIISAFSLQLIKAGHIPPNIGRLFSKVDQIRLAADYSDEEIESGIAKSAVEQADAFIEAIDGYLVKTGCR